MCNIYRGIQNTTYYANIYRGIQNPTYNVKHLSWNSKYNLSCVTFIVKFKIQPIMCNVYRGIQNTTYYV